jgi:hypothetical protein
MGIDHLHGAEVPAGVSDMQTFEVAEARRDLEASALQADGPIAPALAALDTDAEGTA